MPEPLFAVATMSPATAVPCASGVVAFGSPSTGVSIDDDAKAWVVVGDEVGMSEIDADVIDADGDAGAGILVPDFLDVAEVVEMPLLGVERIGRNHAPPEPSAVEG